MSNTMIIVPQSNSLIYTLNLIQLYIGRYFYPFIFIFGNIGSILNVLILTQRVYLQNSCSCYILASSIMNLIIINIVVLFHMLAFGFNIDPTTTSAFFCQFRTYIAHVTTLLSRFYIVLACIDRWAMSSTSVRRRAFSQKNVSNILIPTVFIVMCIISIHIPFYQDIVNERCTLISSTYSIFYNTYNTVLSGFLTPILMIVFGFLTIRNITRSRQRVNIQININRIVGNQQVGRVNIKSREYEILIMILVQLFVYLIPCLPFPMYLVYVTVTLQQVKSREQVAVDRFLSTIAYVLTNINFSATFYIYILTTRVFRKDVKRLLEKIRLFKMIYDAVQDRRAMGNTAT